ncbi:MAG: hypothetical protein M2R45_01040 [Verrucomicrobia subdivision 3 bacterium]|nr:hypothetical protein [Limisphaerales bacterium]MCS1414152.1 hypothetical protein [Limisphaerales bacterium]
MTWKCLPESNRPRPYPFWADIKLNAWAIVAVVLALPNHFVSFSGFEGTVALLRALLTVLPVFPTILWLRSLKRWMDSLDELQRRIQLEAGLGALAWTCLLVTIVSLLRSSSLLVDTRFEQGLGWEGTFASLVFGYLLSCLVVNCRYR